MKTQTQFEDQLLNSIRKYIRTLKQDGTVAMSVDNLMQCVRSPSPTIAGAPQGTNARYFYAQMFRSLCMKITNFKITDLDSSF